MRDILTGEEARDPGRPRVEPGPRPGTWLVYVTEEQAAIIADEVILDPDPEWRQEICTLPGATLVLVQKLRELYWSETHGIVECQGGVWWRWEPHRVSLRHDGLPNERPADAVQMGPDPRVQELLAALDGENSELADSYREKWGL